MKHRSTVTQRPRLEAAESRHAERGQRLRIDLSKYSELRGMKEFVEEFLGDRPPWAGHCLDSAQIAYKRADALLEYLALGDEGLQALGSTLVEALSPYVADVIRVELQKMHVAMERLFQVYEESERRNPARG
jgi:hypothetical protein